MCTRLTRDAPFAGTGTRSNAYTDFHHTVFHVHAPVVGQDGGALLPPVLEALQDIAFAPPLLDSRVEKERKAVISEGQMMNTIEYRVDCALLQHLHWENALGKRFPIGLAHQIEAWPPASLRAFHARWYFPGNATLYVVGDFGEGDDAASEVVRQIETAFGAVPAPWDPTQGGPLRRHSYRPPVKHVYGLDYPLGCPQLTPGTPSAALAAAASAGSTIFAPLPGSRIPVENSPRVFQHGLLQQFSLHAMCKLPVMRVRTLADLKASFAQRVALSVLLFRSAQRASEPGCPFISLDVDHSDSGREGCAVTTLVVNAEAPLWRHATLAALGEVRRLVRGGVSRAELVRYSTSMMRDSQQLAAQAGKVPSEDNLNFIMESDALGHVVMDQVQGHAAMELVAPLLTLEEVNDAAAQMFAFVADYGLQPQHRVPGGAAATAIVACVPDMADGEPLVVSEQDVSDVLADHEGSAAAAAALDAAVTLDGGSFADGEGNGEDEVAIPVALIPAEEVDALVGQQAPHYVLLDGSTPPPGWTPPPPDAASGVAQRRLSNGLRVNWRHSSHEPAGATLVVCAPGGRWTEPQTPGPSGAGAVVVGARTLQETGALGPWTRDQVSAFCMSHLVSGTVEADEEFVSIHAHCAVGDGGMQACLQVLHLMLAQPRWEAAALERAKQQHLTASRTVSKSLERAAKAALVTAMLGNDRRFCDPSEEELAALTLDGVRDAVAAQFATGPLELNVVGDFDGDQLDDLVLRFLGTVQLPAPSGEAAAAVVAAQSCLEVRPLQAVPADSPLRTQRVHIPDSDSRAVAYCVGPAPNRFGLGVPGREHLASAAAAAAAAVSPERAAVRAHPLFHVVTQALLQEVVNSRLFTTVRDVLGLTYDVNFDLSGFDRLHVGWFLLSVTSTPEKVDEALAASLRTLRGIGTQGISARELDRARMTLMTRHDADDKNHTANEKLLALLMHAQYEGAPHKQAAGTGDVLALYKACTVEDVNVAFASLATEPEHVFTCVGTSGSAADQAAAAGAAAASPFGQLSDSLPALGPGMLPPAPQALEQALAALAGSGVVQEMQARYRAMQEQQQRDQEQ